MEQDLDLSRLLEFDELPPPEIFWFERLWLGTIALTVIITITMFDWSMGRVGALPAAMLTSSRFGLTFLLMFLCTRLRSNLVRWIIAVPFTLTIVGYDLIRLPEILERPPIVWVIALRQLLTFASVYLLFTPRARAWFRRTPPEIAAQN